MDPRADRFLPAGPLTYEDYVALPDDGKRYEILDGQLEVTPSPLLRHQTVQLVLATILHRHVAERGLGRIFPAPTDVILAKTTVLVPDLMFVSSARVAILTERAVEGAPDLVVEILSPSTERRDRTAKAALYARFGVPNYWLLDPAERIFEAYALEGEGYRLSLRAAGEQVVRTAPFPELAIELAALWS